MAEDRFHTLAVSPNGQHLAVALSPVEGYGGNDDVLIVHNLARQTQEDVGNSWFRSIRVSGRRIRIRALAWSPDSTCLACATDDTISEWSITQRWTLRNFAHLHPRTIGFSSYVHFSPDGQEIVVSSGGALCMLFVRGWRHRYHVQTTSVAAFSPVAGVALVSVNDFALFLWAETFQQGEARTLPLSWLPPATAFVAPNILCSPNAVRGCGYVLIEPSAPTQVKKRMIRYNGSDRLEIAYTLPHSSQFKAAAFSQDSTILAQAVCYGDMVGLWDVASGQLRRTVVVDTMAVELAFATDQLIVCDESDVRICDTRAWSDRTHRQQSSQTFKEVVFGLVCIYCRCNSDNKLAAHMPRQEQLPRLPMEMWLHIFEILHRNYAVRSLDLFSEPVIPLMRVARTHKG